MRMPGRSAATAWVAALALAACSADPQGSSENRVPSPQAGTSGIAADVANTALPDANYDTVAHLDQRKQGLATESAANADPNKRGSIDPIAVDPYTRADYPDVVKRWGPLIPTINRERRRAAEIAAADPRCDGVLNAQITDHGSRADRHYMTECNNLTRIYFDAASLAAGRAAQVRTQADMGAKGVLDW